MQKILTLMVIFLFSFFTQVTFGANLDAQLSYFDGEVLVHVEGPQKITAKSTFRVSLTNSTGVALTGIPAKWVNATVEMTSMDMGTTKAKVLDVLSPTGALQGVVEIAPQFSMTGPWKLNLKLTSEDFGSEVQSITFTVER